MNLFCRVCSGKLGESRLLDRHASTLECIASLKRRLSESNGCLFRLLGCDRRLLRLLKKHGQLPRRMAA